MALKGNVAAELCYSVYCIPYVDTFSVGRLVLDRRKAVLPSSNSWFPLQTGHYLFSCKPEKSLQSGFDQFG